MRRFEDKVVLVTGAASGIGEACTKRFISEGASVAMVDVNAEALEKAAAAIDGPTATFVCDVTEPDTVKATVEAVVAKFGKLDSLCNIAGIMRVKKTTEMSYEEFNLVIAVNLGGTFLMCQAAIPHLLESKGNIVNMSSTSALGKHPWMAAYAASKGGVLSLTRALFAEYVKKGLRVNAICAGGIMTPLHGNFAVPEGEDFKLIRGAMPPIAMAPPEKAASVVAFLASDDASYVNGESFRVDGGALS